MSEFALHLSRPHQRPIKYFMSNACFELAGKDSHATTVTKLFAKTTIWFFAVIMLLSPTCST